VEEVVAALAEDPKDAVAVVVLKPTEGGGAAPGTFSEPVTDRYYFDEYAAFSPEK
jgi:hypothetical protein